jgi:hypothetical protein
MKLGRDFATTGVAAAGVAVNVLDVSLNERESEMFSSIFASPSLRRFFSFSFISFISTFRPSTAFQ